MILATYGSAKKCHDLIADEFIQSTVVAKDRIRRGRVKPIELIRDFGWLELLGQRGKAANIDEQDRDVHRLPARRSEFVSKRAKIGVLARRSNLQQPKRQRADAEKRHEAFFAAFARRQEAVESARYPGGPEALAKRDKKFSHKVVLKTYSKGTEKPGLQAAQKDLRGEAREKSASGGVHRQYVTRGD
jgi:hypothetical protein